MLVAHDWGCFYGYLFDQKYPKYFNQIMAMDVPPHAELNTISKVLMVMAYQLFLAFAFFIGGPIGRSLTLNFVKFSRHNPPYLNQINSARNYPYYYLWKRIFLSLLRLKKPYLNRRYEPSVPLVYMYGSKKPFQFHG